MEAEARQGAYRNVENVEFRQHDPTNSKKKKKSFSSITIKVKALSCGGSSI